MVMSASGMAQQGVRKEYVIGYDCRERRGNFCVASVTESLCLDPLKLAYMQAAQRHRTLCVASPSCQSHDPDFYNFSRLLIKNGRM